MKFTKQFWAGCGSRALYTIAECILALIPASATIDEVNFKVVATTALLAGLVSVCKSIVFGIPEANEVEN